MGGGGGGCEGRLGGGSRWGNLGWLGGGGGGRLPLPPLSGPGGQEGGGEGGGGRVPEPRRRPPPPVFVIWFLGPPGALCSEAAARLTFFAGPSSPPSVIKAGDKSVIVITRGLCGSVRPWCSRRASSSMLLPTKSFHLALLSFTIFVACFDVAKMSSEADTQSSSFARRSCRILRHT